MRYGSLLVTVAVVGVCGLVLGAGEKAPDDYTKAMKDLGAAVQGVGKAGEDFDAVAKFAVSAKAAFEVAEKYWTAKRVDDAVLAAQNGAKAAADLGVAANLKSAEGIEAAAKDMAAVCMSCHTAHRERLPDGSFQIK